MPVFSSEIIFEHLKGRCVGMIMINVKVKENTVLIVLCFVQSLSYTILEKIHFFTMTNSECLKKLTTVRKNIPLNREGRRAFPTALSTIKISSTRSGLFCPSHLFPSFFSK